MDAAFWFEVVGYVASGLIALSILQQSILRLRIIGFIGSKSGTLKGWGLVFILWGDTGGPGGAAMLPGLYMFRKAFTDLEAGYACGIGLMLFVLILVLTLINNKYVRVEK